MFDIGFVEMLVIGIVALIVIGPERLPTVARKVGLYVGKIRRFVSNVRSDVEREFKTDELQRMLQQQQQELNSLKDTVNHTVNETAKDADLSDVEASLKDSISDDKPEPQTFGDDGNQSKPKSVDSH